MGKCSARVPAGLQACTLGQTSRPRPTCRRQDARAVTTRRSKRSRVNERQQQARAGLQDTSSFSHARQHGAPPPRPAPLLRSPGAQRQYPLTLQPSAEEHLPAPLLQRGRALPRRSGNRNPHNALRLAWCRVRGARYVGRHLWGCVVLLLFPRGYVRCSTRAVRHGWKHSRDEVRIPGLVMRRHAVRPCTLFVSSAPIS